MACFNRAVCSATVAVIAVLSCHPVLAGPVHAKETGSRAPALYASGQIVRGERLYTDHCAACHGVGLQGANAAALAGRGFLSADMSVRLGEWFLYMSQAMPQGRPGALSREEYADLMALILNRNGYPAGSTALTYEDASSSSEVLYSMDKK
jgi:Cytochrome c.